MDETERHIRCRCVAGITEEQKPGPGYGRTQKTFVWSPDLLKPVGTMTEAQLRQAIHDLSLCRMCGVRFVTGQKLLAMPNDPTYLVHKRCTL